MKRLAAALLALLGAVALAAPIAIVGSPVSRLYVELGDRGGGDPDPESVLSINNPSVEEGDSGTVELTFVLSAPEAQDFNIVCDYETQDGTATAGSDYTAASGEVQIDAGDTSADIVVTVTGDSANESDEYLQVSVTNCGRGATEDNATEYVGTGTIVDDDSAVIADSISYTRSNSTITFSFTCTGGCQTGTFADGWRQWVAPVTAGGSVTLTGITPATTGSGTSTRNGAMKDPVNLSSQGFTGQSNSYIGGFNADLVLTFPHVITPASVGRPTVIIKSISGPDANCSSTTYRQCFTHFETLTVLADDPGDVFAPPWFGTNKFMVDGSLFDTSFLPELPSTAGVGWDTAVNVARGPWMQPLLSSWESSQGLSARINQNTERGYHGYVVMQINAAMLKLTQAASGDNIAKKQQLARSVAQLGIDLYGITTTPGLNSVGCAPWFAQGGFNAGRLAPIVLAANLLQQDEWLEWLDEKFSTQDGRACFAETSAVQRNPSELGKGVPTFGYLDSALYNISDCNRNNQNCASQGGRSSGSVSNYDGLADGDPLTADYPPAYMDIQGGQAWSAALPILFIPQVRETFPENGDHWLRWIVRVKTAGDPGTNTIRYYNNVSNTNTGSMNLSYISPGVSTMWAAFKDCYADNSCEGMPE